MSAIMRLRETAECLRKLYEKSSSQKEKECLVLADKAVHFVSYSEKAASEFSQFVSSFDEPLDQNQKEHLKKLGLGSIDEQV
jgi:hypothetical protein